MRFVASVLVVAALAGSVSAPVAAQRNDAPAVLTAGDLARTDRRLNKLEGEMRAVQRKVFPGGAAGAIEPEITAPVAPAMGPGGTPASNPLTDLAQRVGEMERQLRTLTGQVEANEFKVRQLETAMTRLQGDLEFRLGRLEGGQVDGTGAPPADPGFGLQAAAPPPASIAGTRPGQMLPPVGTARVPTAPPPAAPTPTGPAATGPTPTGPAAIEEAVPRGATAVAAWQAAYGKALNKDWPGTEAHMAAFLANWPQSTRIPQAQYWLGRSYAERALHAQAADAYLKVYNKHPRSERAPDALLGLAGALVGIKNPQQGCRVLGELDSVYAKTLTPAQQAEAKTLRTRARCAA